MPPAKSFSAQFCHPIVAKSAVGQCQRAEVAYAATGAPGILFVPCEIAILDGDPLNAGRHPTIYYQHPRRGVAIQRQILRPRPDDDQILVHHQFALSQHDCAAHYELNLIARVRAGQCRPHRTRRRTATLCQRRKASTAVAALGTLLLEKTLLP
jgi:hypothetical protein